MRSKASSGQQQASKAGASYNERKATALAAKNTSVLSYDELERIKGMCSQTSDKQDYHTMRVTERAELQGLSNARVSKWPNTIHAQRERKEYERIKKLEDDEVSFILQKSPLRFMIFISYIFQHTLTFFNIRSKEEELMPRKRTTNKKLDRTNWTKPTNNSMITKIWLRLFTVRCLCVMLHPSRSNRDN